MDSSFERCIVMRQEVRLRLFFSLQQFLSAILKMINAVLLFSMEGFMPTCFSGTQYLDNFKNLFKLRDSDISVEKVCP